MASQTVWDEIQVELEAAGVLPTSPFFAGRDFVTAEERATAYELATYWAARRGLTRKEMGRWAMSSAGSRFMREIMSGRSPKAEWLPGSGFRG
jgi:hypothetical protein